MEVSGDHRSGGAPFPRSLELGTKPAGGLFHFVVFTVRRGLDAADAGPIRETDWQEVRGGTVEALAGYRNVMVTSPTGPRTAGTLDQWQTHQVYIALGQFMASAALLGVDTCPMEDWSPRDMTKSPASRAPVTPRWWPVRRGTGRRDDKYIHLEEGAV